MDRAAVKICERFTKWLGYSVRCLFITFTRLSSQSRAANSKRLRTMRIYAMKLIICYTTFRDLLLSSPGFNIKNLQNKYINDLHNLEVKYPVTSIYLSLLPVRK